MLAALIADMRGEVDGEGLRALIDACEGVARRLLGADADDRLAASYPFLTMLSVAVCGWLMERQGRAAATAEGDTEFLAMKQAAAEFYALQIVPEALGLRAAALAPSATLYAVGPAGFAA